VSAAALVQEQEAIWEADEVAEVAGLAEVAAIQEAEDTVDLAARVEAAATVTAAEKRLLRYLNTGLTFAMIGDKMHISRGAVKDRASRVYKKLGVHNREDAVEVAVELGVIKG
jgi:DNA-binding NarL/FixJ family response regulator